MRVQGPPAMSKVSGCLRLVLGLLATQALAGDFRISSYDRQGNVTWTNAFFSGVCTIEAAATLPADSLNSQWRVQQNYFTTNSTGQGALVPNSSNRFFRLVAVDVSTNTPLGYANLVASYGLLRTVAGNGYGAVDGSNYWQASFEGVVLSGGLIFCACLLESPRSLGIIPLRSNYQS